MLSEMLKDALHFFVYSTSELTLLFVGISFLVGLINEFISADKVQNILASKGGRGYLAGAILGAVTPFCSCSTIPITVGFLNAGAGFGPTMSFLFTSPLLNPIIIGLFLMTFGWKATLIYSGIALIMSVSVSFFLEKSGFSRYIRNVRIIGQTSDKTAKTPMEIKQRIRNVAREAVKQFFSFIPYILLGIGIGSILHGFVPRELLSRYTGADNLFAIPFAAIIGVPLYVRASTMIPIGLSLISKGASIGMVVALLIGGAGASIPEVIMLKRIFKMPILAAFLISVFSMAVISGYVFNLVLA